MDGFLTGDSDHFAVMIGGGSYVVADPQAPLEHGCPCVLQVDAGKWLTGAKVVTKHPMRAKTLRIDTGSVVVRVARRECVARVVGKFIATTWWPDIQDLPSVEDAA
jgi:hypothetical protein